MRSDFSGRQAAANPSSQLGPEIRGQKTEPRGIIAGRQTGPELREETAAMQLRRQTRCVLCSGMHEKHALFFVFVGLAYLHF